MVNINCHESILTLFGIHERLQKVRDYNIQIEDVEYSKMINYLLNYEINDKNEMDSVIVHWCLHLIIKDRPKRFLPYWRLDIIDKWTRQLENNNYAVFEIIKTFEMMILSAKEWIIHNGNSFHQSSYQKKDGKKPLNMAFTSLGTNIDDCTSRITEFIVDHLTDHPLWYLSYLETLIFECKGKRFIMEGREKGMQTRKENRNHSRELKEILIMNLRIWDSHLGSKILFILSEFPIDDSLNLYLRKGSKERDGENEDGIFYWENMDSRLLGAILTIMTRLTQVSKLNFSLAKKFINETRMERIIQYSDVRFVISFCKLLTEMKSDEHLELWKLIIYQFAFSSSSLSSTHSILSLSSSSLLNSHLQSFDLIIESDQESRNLLLDSIICGGGGGSFLSMDPLIPLLFLHRLIRYYRDGRGENGNLNQSLITDTFIHALGTIFDQKVYIDSSLFQIILKIMIEFDILIEDSCFKVLSRYSWTLANLIVNYELDHDNSIELINSFKRIVERNQKCLTSALRGMSILLSKLDIGIIKGNCKGEFVISLMISYIRLALNNQSSAKTIWNASCAIRNICNNITIPSDLLDIMIDIMENTDNFKIKISILETLLRIKYDITDRIRMVYRNMKMDHSFHAMNYKENIEKLNEYYS